MVRLEIETTTPPPQSGRWSTWCVLSDSLVLDGANDPIWIVGIELTSETANIDGPLLYEQLVKEYQTLGNKDAATCFSVLCSTKKTDESSIVALCIVGHKVTVIKSGYGELTLCRNDKQGHLLTGDEGDWQSLEGEWQIGDQWQLSVGKSETALTAQIIEMVESPIIDPELPVIPKQSPPNILKRRRVMVAGWLILALLIASVWYGAKTRAEKRLQATYKALEAQVSTSIATAQSLKTTDQIQARQQIRDLQTQLDQAKSRFGQDKTWLAKWQGLLTTANTAYQQLAGETDLTNLPVWFDLSVVRSNFSGNRLLATTENLIVLDAQSSTVIKVGMTSKRAEVIAGGDAIKNPLDLTVSGAKAIILTDGGISEISLARKTTTSLIERGNEWQQPALLGTFNGNIYLFDKGTSDILRFPAIAGGIGSGQRWLGDGVTISSGTDIVSLALDGDLWLLKRTGTVLRYRRGAPLNFTISGSDQPLSSSITAFSVSNDADTIAILDQGNQRVVLVDKQGSYQKQIKWTGLTNAQDIALSSDAKTLYILKQGSIYTAQL